MCFDTLIYTFQFFIFLLDQQEWSVLLTIVYLQEFLKNVFLPLAYVNVSICVLDEEPHYFSLSISSHLGNSFDQDMLFYYLRLECILVMVTHLSYIL